MKVICIDDSNYAAESKDSQYDIYFGDILTVRGFGSDENWLTFVEYPEDCEWPKNKFAPLSSIDETEFERNYQKEKV